MIPGVRKEIEDYIYSEIVPRYAEFDPAHREDHAVAVIDNSMKLYREAPAELRSGIDPEVLAVAAAAGQTTSVSRVPLTDAVVSGVKALNQIGGQLGFMLVFFAARIGNQYPQQQPFFRRHCRLF